MANRPMTAKLVKELAKHGDVVEQQFEELLLSKSITPNDVDLTVAIEHDFGPDWRSRLNRIGDDAMEAIITSGTFNKMVQKVIRTSLREEPKEEYVLSRLASSETKGECEGIYEDHGVFSDIQAHEVCELEAGPLYGVATDFLRHPNGKQASAGIAFTREAMCKDPNGFLMQQIPKLRDAHMEYKENKLIDTFIGYLPTFNRSGTLYDTYYESGSATPYANGGPWVNASADDIACSSDFDAIKELFWDMRDMVHGRPVLVDTNNLTIITSRQKANRMRPFLLAQAVECDQACSGEGNTCKYIMTAEVANGGTYTVVPYQRMVDRLILRYSLTAMQAEDYMWLGQSVANFISWVSQIAPEVTRCPLGTEECRKRIVAVYSSLSKGYAYIRDPYKGIMLTGDGSDST